MRAALIAIVLVTATCPREREERVKEIAASTFRSWLQCGDPAVRNQSQCEDLREDLAKIETVRVEPRANGSARYVLTMKTVVSRS